MLSEVDARSFFRMEGKLDQLLDEFRRHAKDDTDWHEQIGTRLGQLEQAHSYSEGRASSRASIISILVSIVTSSVAALFFGKYT